MTKKSTQSKPSTLIIIGIFIIVTLGFLIKKLLLTGQVAQVAEIGSPLSCVSFLDDFNQSALNQKAWNVSNNYTSQKNGDIRFVLPASSTNQKSDLTYMSPLTGNFLVSTTIRNLTLGSALNYGSAEMWLVDGNENKYNIGLRRGNGIAEMTSWHLNNPNPVGKSDMVTTNGPAVVEFLRQGSTLTAYYRLTNSAISTKLAEFPNVNGPLTLSLHSASYEQRPKTTALFSDFSLRCF